MNETQVWLILFTSHNLSFIQQIHLFCLYISVATSLHLHHSPIPLHPQSAKPINTGRNAQRQLTNPLCLMLQGREGHTHTCSDTKRFRKTMQQHSEHALLSASTPPLSRTHALTVVCTQTHCWVSLTTLGKLC